MDAFSVWVEAESVVPRSWGYASTALGHARHYVAPLRRLPQGGRPNLVRSLRTHGVLRGPLATEARTQ